MNDLESQNRNARMTALIVRHRSTLYGYIFSCVPQHADAEDILQEVSLTVTANFEKLTDESGFLPWALEIARRHVLHHFRKGKRVTVLSPELLSSLVNAALLTSQQPNESERVDALMGCLEILPPRSKELIARRYDGSVDDVTELAARTGRTVSATYAQLKRIRRWLRECIERKLTVENA